MIRFPQRPRKEQAPCGTRAVWMSRGREYRITRLLGVPPVFLVCRRAVVYYADGCHRVWAPAGKKWRFRTLRAAMQAAAQFEG